MSNDKVRTSGEYMVSGHWMERMEQKQDEQLELMMTMREERIRDRAGLEAANCRIDGLKTRMDRVESTHAKVGWGIISAVGAVAVSSIIALWTWICK